MGLRTIILLLFVLFTVCGTVHASWTGPSEEVSGSWGNQPGQFAINYQDTHDIFPTTIAISSSGQIAISEDQTIKRVQIFKSRTLERIIDTFAFDLVFNSNSDLFVTGGGFRKYDSTGNQIWSKSDVFFDALYAVNDGSIIGYDSDSKSYSFYSPTGQLIKTSTTRPLELGKVTSIGVGSGQYRTTAEFPDVTYQFIDTQPTVKFYRDLKSNFFRIETFTDTVGGEEVTAYKVHKYEACSKKIGLLDMPRSTYEPMPPSAADMPTWKPAPVMEYGEPIVAPNGDVYAWARTKTQYKILKWTWKDDPNVPTGPDAPTGLSVMPSTTGLYLTWTASPQDPGCVSGYEIARATSAGGVYSTIVPVEKGVIKYNDTTASAGTTYYYKVRAKAGSEYSPYTSPVSGKR